MSSSDRMLAILSQFTLERSELTVEDIAEQLGTSMRTTYRYVRSLAAAGFLAPMRQGRYVLGPAAVQLDWLIRKTDPLTSAAAPAMSILANAMEIPSVILLCRLYKDQVMCISQASAGHPSFASSYQRGRPMPLFRGAASKAILASLPRRKIIQLHRQYGEEMADGGLGAKIEEVLAALSAITEAGICRTSGELDPGLTGFATPLPGSDVLPTGSLAAVVHDSRLTPEISAGIERLLKAGAHQVTATLQSV